MPTIFTTMAKTPFTLTFSLGDDNTWSGDSTSTLTMSGFGVFKPRNDTDNPSLDPAEVGAPTLNIPPNLPNSMGLKNLEGAEVAVDTEDFVVTAVATGKNFRTGKIEHYRLELREKSQ